MGKQEECQGCIGITDDHTCEGWDEFQKMKADAQDVVPRSRLAAALVEIEQSRNYLEIAYSEMAFAVGTIASRNEQNYDYRSKKLAEFCNELRAFLDGKTVTTKVCACPATMEDGPVRFKCVGEQTPGCKKTLPVISSSQ